MKYNERPYQGRMTDFILTNSFSGLFAEMGLGKTISALTALQQLISDYEVARPLIIAPLLVAETVWSDEIDKWDHLKGLRIAKVLGEKKHRLAALKEKADIWIINRENVAWLVTHFQDAWPFDMIIIDESSSFKDHKSERFKALRMVRPLVKRMVLLTGTPAPNGLMNLWSQLYLLDMGQRLGKNITWYRDEYFIQKRSGFGYRLRDGADKVIHSAISDICISLRSEDYLKLPGRIDTLVRVVLPPDARKRYDEFERDSVLELLGQEGEEITALSAAALRTKLLQFSNGAVYDSERKWHEVHTAKLDRLEEMLEGLEGKSCIITYSFKHDAERILKRLGKRCRLLDTKNGTDVKDWNEGRIEFLLMHPASAAHGLNMQYGGHHIIHYGQTDSVELRLQVDKRLDRPGQEFVVQCMDLICVDTMDEAVILNRNTKMSDQDALMAAVKARIEKWVGVEV